MARPAARAVLAVICLLSGLLVSSSAASASVPHASGTGGSGLTGTVAGTDTDTTTSTTVTVPPPIDLITIVGTATTSGRGIKLSASSVSQSGARLALQGKAGNSARRVVQVQYKYSTSARWQFATAVVTGRGGSFIAHWRVPARGSLRLRAVLLPGSLHAVTASVQSTAAAHGPATPMLEVTVLRSAIATYYGNKSLWGHKT